MNSQTGGAQGLHGSVSCPLHAHICTSNTAQDRVLPFILGTKLVEDLNINQCIKRCVSASIKIDVCRTSVSNVRCRR